jgi:hypothetical protein
LKIGRFENEGYCAGDSRKNQALKSLAIHHHQSKIRNKKKPPYGEAKPYL